MKLTTLPLPPPGREGGGGGAWHGRPQYSDPARHGHVRRARPAPPAQRHERRPRRPNCRPHGRVGGRIRFIHHRPPPSHPRPQPRPHIVFQHCYVKNVAHAHVCAARALRDRPAKVGGRAYVIVDGPASNFWCAGGKEMSWIHRADIEVLRGREFFADFIRAAGIWMPPTWLYMPRWLVSAGGVIPSKLLSPLSLNQAMFLAYTMVFIAAVLRPLVHWQPLVRAENFPLSI